MTNKIPKEKLYRICSLTYRLVMGAFIIFSIVAPFLTVSAGMHGRGLSNMDYLAFILIVICGIVLTVLPDISERHPLIRKVLRYTAGVIVLATAIFGLYGLYDGLRDYDFSAAETILDIILILFVFICALLLKGLIKDMI